MQFGFTISWCYENNGQKKKKKITFFCVKKKRKQNVVTIMISVGPLPPADGKGTVFSVKLKGNRLNKYIEKENFCLAS